MSQEEEVIEEVNPVIQALSSTDALTAIALLIVIACTVLTLQGTMSEGVFKDIITGDLFILLINNIVKQNNM